MSVCLGLEGYFSIPEAQSSMCPIISDQAGNHALVLVSLLGSTHCIVSGILS